jgi:SAM-dependent methyltransferase
MIYNRYAEVYDSSGQVHFSLRMIGYLTDLLPHHGWEGESALDLACGTGTLTLAYAQGGLRAYGVDASAPMLAQARQKAAELGLEARWSQQDMRAFSLPEQADLVTCCYDSLNYLLSEDDLRATFRQVAAVLRPGGLFVFDVNTPWMYENLGADTSFADGEDLGIVLQASYDRGTRLATWKLTGFVKREAMWERFDETHVQRSFATAELAGALSSAGLAEEGRYACFSLDVPQQDTSREMWVARKPL